MTYTVKEEGLTVDLICWRVYGRTAQVTEAVFAANPELGRTGLHLPLGMVLTLPDSLPAPAPALVRLYD